MFIMQQVSAATACLLHPDLVDMSQLTLVVPVLTCASGGLLTVDIVQVDAHDALLIAALARS